jgi:hypothetical protein
MDHVLLRRVESQHMFNRPTEKSTGVFGNSCVFEGMFALESLGSSVRPHLSHP